MAQGKPFKELDLSDAFLFAAALQDEKETYLPKRSRYYHAVMDMSS